MERLYNRILVPTDFRPSSRVAYRMAFAIASAAGAPITLFHVLPIQEIGDYQGLDAFRLLHWAAEQAPLHRLRAAGDSSEAAEPLHRRLRAEVSSAWTGSIDLQTEVRFGDVAGEVARYANEAGVDLIVMIGSRPGVLPTLSRRMSDRVGRLTPATVLRITPPGSESRPVPQATDRSLAPRNAPGRRT